LSDTILVLNAGSSSIKFAFYPTQGREAPRLSGAVDRIGGAATLALTKEDGSFSRSDIDAPDHESANGAMAYAAETHLPQTDVRFIRHRIVRGGTELSQPTVLSRDIVEALEALSPPAALHQPHSLRGAHEAAHLFPAATQIACFDTAFHASKPWLHDSFALPQSFYDAGLRGHRFHGLSCQSILRTHSLP